jgi:hypothetical protein
LDKLIIDTKVVWQQKMYMVDRKNKTVFPISQVVDYLNEDLTHCIVVYNEEFKDYLEFTISANVYDVEPCSKTWFTTNLTKDGRRYTYLHYKFWEILTNLGATEIRDEDEKPFLKDEILTWVTGVYDENKVPKIYKLSKGFEPDKISFQNWIYPLIRHQGYTVLD